MIKYSHSKSRKDGMGTSHYGNLTYSELSGQNLYEQVSADSGPGLGHEGESVRNPLSLFMGRVKRIRS